MNFFFCSSMYQNHMSGHAGTAQLPAHREYWLTQPDISLQQAQLPWLTADGIVQEAWWGTDGKGYGTGSQPDPLQSSASGQASLLLTTAALGHRDLGHSSPCAGGQVAPWCVCVYIYIVLISQGECEISGWISEVIANWADLCNVFCVLSRTVHKSLKVWFKFHSAENERREEWRQRNAKI